MEELNEAVQDDVFTILRGEPDSTTREIKSEDTFVQTKLSYVSKSASLSIKTPSSDPVIPLDTRISHDSVNSPNRKHLFSGSKPRGESNIAFSVPESVGGFAFNHDFEESLSERFEQIERVCDAVAKQDYNDINLPNLMKNADTNYLETDSLDNLITSADPNRGLDVVTSPPKRYDLIEDLLMSVQPGKMPQLSDWDVGTYTRPAAIADCLAEDKKVRIFVLHDRQITVVSWYEDTDLRDVQNAILCACDAMANSGVALLELIALNADILREELDRGQGSLGGSLVKVEVDGAPMWYKRGSLFTFEDFPSLKHGHLYQLQSGPEREELQFIVGDRQRRLNVAISPLDHVEVHEAIRSMQIGTNLLRATVTEDVHIRYFRLSADLRRLLWISTNKSVSQAAIPLNEVIEIKVHDDVDWKLSIHSVKHLCFAVVTAKHSYNLCAQNESDFDTWLTGLKALSAYFQGVKLTKSQLLGHSRKFRGLATDDDTEAPKDLAGLTTISKSRSDHVKSLEILQNLLSNYRSQANAIDYTSLATIVDGDLQENIEDTKIIAFIENLTKNDRQLEHNTMMHLLARCDDLLQNVRRDLELHLERSQDNAPQAEMDKLIVATGANLWRAQVDLETTGDIINRLNNADQPLTFSQLVADFQKMVEGPKTTISNAWKNIKSIDILTPAKAIFNNAPSNVNESLQ